VQASTGATVQLTWDPAVLAWSEAKSTRRQGGAPPIKQGACRSTTVDQAAGQWTCALADVASNDVVAFTYQFEVAKGVEAGRGFDMGLAATARSDGRADNNRASFLGIALPPQVDLKLTGSVTPPSIAPGAGAVVALYVSNAGLTTSRSSTVVCGPWPAALAVTRVPTVCTLVEQDQGGGTTEVRCTLPPIDRYGVMSAVIEAVASSEAAADGQTGFAIPCTVTDDTLEYVLSDAAQGHHQPPTLCACLPHAHAHARDAGTATRPTIPRRSRPSWRPRRRRPRG
jgi:hypothetical protein